MRLKAFPKGQLLLDARAQRLGHFPRECNPAAGVRECHLAAPVPGRNVAEANGLPRSQHERRWGMAGRQPQRHSVEVEHVVPLGKVKRHVKLVRRACRLRVLLIIIILLHSYGGAAAVSVSYGGAAAVSVAAPRLARGAHADLHPLAPTKKVESGSGGKVVRSWLLVYCARGRRLLPVAASARGRARACGRHPLPVQVGCSRSSLARLGGTVLHAPAKVHGAHGRARLVRREEFHVVNLGAASGLRAAQKLAQAQRRNADIVLPSSSQPPNFLPTSWTIRLIRAHLA